MVAQFIFLLSLTWAADKPAAEKSAIKIQKLFSMSNDRNPGVTNVEFEVDSAGAVKAVRWIGEKQPKSFSPSQLAEFQVIEAQQGVDAVLLKGNVGTDAGEFTIKFVYNGIIRSYRECTYKVKKSAEGEWQALRMTDGVRISSARMVTRAIGIKKIEGLCPDDM